MACDVGESCMSPTLLVWTFAHVHAYKIRPGKTRDLLAKLGHSNYWNITYLIIFTNRLDHSLLSTCLHWHLLASTCLPNLVGISRGCASVHNDLLISVHATGIYNCFFFFAFFTVGHIYLSQFLFYNPQLLTRFWRKRVGGGSQSPQKLGHHTLGASVWEY